LQTALQLTSPQNLKRFLRENFAVITVIFIGVLLRLRQYLTGRSLWLDEAMLALNIVNRNFAGLLKPLDYDQGAPPGFLLVEKMFNVLLGKNELVLRLFPLMAGLVSLWLFYLLLRQITTSNVGLWIPLALFAVNPRLVYYSSEVKQYSLDVTVTIILLLLAGRLFKEHPQVNDFAWFTLTGILALWFSHPALFLLGGIGLALLVIHFKRRDMPVLRSTLIMEAVWLVNLALVYLLILKDLRQNNFIREYWQDAFVPIPPWSNLRWYASTVSANIALQFVIPFLPLLIFGFMLAGWVILWKKQLEYALIIAGILLVTLTASALQLYPLLERMILFLLPIGLILLGKFLDAIQQNWNASPILKNVILFAFSFYWLYSPFATSLNYFVHPKYFEHIRPAMAYLQEKVRDGDVLYVSYGAVPAFRFYASGYKLDQIRYVPGERDDYQSPQLIEQRLDSLKGQQRVWVLMSHVYEQGTFNERDFIVARLDQIGKQVREVGLSGTSVYLYFYDLGKP